MGVITGQYGISNVCYYTTMYVQVWQPDSSLTLWIKEGAFKETPDKKRRRAVRSGRTSKFVKTIENGFSSIKIPFSILMPWALLWKFPVVNVTFTWAV